MGFFGSKKDGNGAGDAASAAGASGGFSPEKAQGFFKHARTAPRPRTTSTPSSSGSPGLKFDPPSMEGLMGVFASIDQFMRNGRQPISKDVAKTVGAAQRRLESTSEASSSGDKRPTLRGPGVRRCRQLGLAGPGEWIGERALTG